MGKKILLVGETGTFKTVTCLLIAKRMVEMGKKVLYVDMERGTEDYREEWDLDGIEFVDVGENAWDDVMEAVRSAEHDLFVLDPYDMVEAAREKYRRVLVEKGVVIGGSQEPVKMTIRQDEADVFDLSGWLYQVPNRMIKDFVRMVIRRDWHVIFTGIMGVRETSAGGSKGIRDLYPKFSVIVEMQNIAGKPRGKVIKWRARKVSNVIDPFKELGMMFFNEELKLEVV